MIEALIVSLLALAAVGVITVEPAALLAAGRLGFFVGEWRARNWWRAGR